MKKKKKNQQLKKKKRIVHVVHGFPYGPVVVTWFIRSPLPSARTELAAGLLDLTPNGTSLAPECLRISPAVRTTREVASEVHGRAFISPGLKGRSSHGFRNHEGILMGWSSMHLPDCCWWKLCFIL
jgi:hypothetical protein